jgi:hypothetical protein
MNVCPNSFWNSIENVRNYNTNLDSPMKKSRVNFCFIHISDTLNEFSNDQVIISIVWIIFIVKVRADRFAYVVIQNKYP